MVIDAPIRLGQRIPGIWWPAEWHAPWLGTVTLAALLAVVLAEPDVRALAAAGEGAIDLEAQEVLALVFGMKFG